MKEWKEKILTHKHKKQSMEQTTMDIERISIQTDPIMQQIMQF